MIKEFFAKNDEMLNLYTQAITKATAPTIRKSLKSARFTKTSKRR